MHRIPIKRIIFAVVITTCLCFISTVCIQANCISLLELLIKYDKQFLKDNYINAVTAISIGSSNMWFTVLIPFIVSITGLFSFADTMQGFWRMEYIRTSKRRYRISKFFSICLPGALSVTLGYLVYIIIVFPFFPYATPLTISSHDGAPDETFNEALSAPEYAFEVFKKLGFIFIFSFITCAICLCIYLLIKNRYKAIGMPLIAYYLLINISTSLISKSNFLEPKYQVISPSSLIADPASFYSQTFNISYGWVLLAQLLVILGIYFIYAKLLDWRLKR